MKTISAAKKHRSKAAIALRAICLISSGAAARCSLPLLQILARQQPTFVLHEVKQMLVDEYVPRNMGAEELLLEGTDYLENIGFRAEAISLSFPARMLILTRASRAATLNHQTGTHAGRALQSADLLHPTSSHEALPGIDRGLDDF